MNQKTNHTLPPDIAAYWTEVAKGYTWKKPWTELFEGNFYEAKFTWFKNAKLNLTENCLDRHLATRRNQKAVIFEANDPNTPEFHLTYGELHISVCRFANMLKNKGIKKGDVVCFYMGMSPELMIGILACMRIGAVFTVVFAGFSPLALRGRIENSKARMVITHDEALRADKTIALKEMVDEAIKDLSFVETVIVVKKTHKKIEMQAKRDYYYDTLIKEAALFCDAEEMDSEDPLFILYTSGSTGQPKGILHTTAGYMVAVGQSFKEVFDYKENDLFWCTADIGWITGHSYTTLGPLLNGGTTLIYEGTPTYPTADRFWQIIEKHNVTHLYTAPTAIRALEQLGSDIPNKYKMKSLKVLGSVGEPINEEAWQWYHKNVGKGRCPIVDTWWQTETGAIMISTLANKTEVKPGYATYPLKGIDPVLVDEKGTIIEEITADGRLCIRTPWPSIARTIYGDHEKYINTYFSTYKGLYFTGDGARREANGMYRITGRIDDVINVSGHRLGTAEIEEAINQHPAVVESAVVGVPHPIKGQGIYAFVIPDKKIDDVAVFEQEVRNMVQEIIGPIAKPDLIHVVSDLPKTRSGKIMRRILRKIGNDEIDTIGDISTLSNPEAVEKIINTRKKLN